MCGQLRINPLTPHVRKTPYAYFHPVRTLSLPIYLCDLFSPKPHLHNPHRHGVATRFQTNLHRAAHPPGEYPRCANTASEKLANRTFLL